MKAKVATALTKRSRNSFGSPKRNHDNQNPRLGQRQQRKPKIWNLVPAIVTVSDYCNNETVDPVARRDLQIMEDSVKDRCAPGAC